MACDALQRMRKAGNSTPTLRAVCYPQNQANVMFSELLTLVAEAGRSTDCQFGGSAQELFDAW